MRAGDPIRRMVAEQARAQRQRLWLSMAAGGVVAAAAVTLLGLSGWFITAAALAGAAGPAVAQAFNYLTPSAIIRLLAIIRTGSRYVERVAGHEAGLKALARMRPLLFTRLAAQPPQRALALASGEASARLVQDVDALQTLFIRRSGDVGVAVGAGVSVLMATLAAPLAGAVLAGALAVTVLGALALGRRIDTAGRAIQVAAGRMQDTAMALHAARAELRAYGLETWAVDTAAARGEALDAQVRQAGARAGWLQTWAAVMTGVAVAGVMLAAPASQPPLVALAALAAVMGVEAASGLAAALRQRGGAEAALDRLAELATPPDADPARADDPDGDDLVLAGVPLAPGRRLAIMGRSGAGKTTLIERLMGLRPAHADEARIGGVAVGDLSPGAIRRRFAYAAQDARFLDGTARENLRLAAPGASDAELWAALDDVALGERLRADRGLDTPLGADAGRLSGGERRRLALARAYLRPAPWLVLDEPTEGLDPATRARVLEGLERRLAAAGQGLIVVSHGPDFQRLCALTLRVDGRVADGRVITALA